MAYKIIGALYATLRWSAKVYSRALWDDDETAPPVHGGLKKRVALEALRGDRTVQAIAAKHEVHPNQVGTWKRQAVEGLDEVFARGGSPGPSEHEATIRDLTRRSLTMERDFFQRGLQR